jgi:hypothetical protein
MFHLRVTLPGVEPIEVEADSRDIVAWERLGKGRHFGQLESALRMTDLAELGWFACERAGSLPNLPDRPKFLEQAIVLPFAPESEEDDERLDPTRPAA